MFVHSTVPFVCRSCRIYEPRPETKCTGALRVVRNGLDVSILETVDPEEFLVKIFGPISPQVWNRRRHPLSCCEGNTLVNIFHKVWNQKTISTVASQLCSLLLERIQSHNFNQNKSYGILLFWACNGIGLIEYPAKGNPKIISDLNFPESGHDRKRFPTKEEVNWSMEKWVEELRGTFSRRHKNWFLQWRLCWKSFAYVQM